MPRELPTFREHLEDILAFFNGKRMLATGEVARYLGKSREWTREKLGVPTEGITAIALAHKLAQEYSLK